MLSIHEAPLRGNKIVLIYDSETAMPCLYPMLYAIAKYRDSDIEHQRFSAESILMWYVFWQNKKSEMFCASLYLAECAPHIYISEIYNLIVYLEHTIKATNNLLSDRQKATCYSSVILHIEAIFKFFHYILDEFWNPEEDPIAEKQLKSMYKGDLKKIQNTYVRFAKKKLMQELFNKSYL